VREKIQLALVRKTLIFDHFGWKFWPFRAGEARAGSFFVLEIVMNIIEEPIKQ
jgi:hypothetical protein